MKNLWTGALIDFKTQYDFIFEFPTMREEFKKTLINNSTFNDVYSIAAHVDIQTSWKFIPRWFGFKSHCIARYYASAYQNKSFYTTGKDTTKKIKNSSVSAHFNKEFKLTLNQYIGQKEYDAWNPGAFFLTGLGALSLYLWHKGFNPLLLLKK